jgi:hypothetical protein
VGSDDAGSVPLGSSESESAALEVGCVGTHSLRVKRGGECVLGVRRGEFRLEGSDKVVS